MNELERRLNDVTRDIIVRSNYDSHFANIEERILTENRLFLARWAIVCETAGINPETFLPLSQPRRRNAARGIVYQELCRAEYISSDPVHTGTHLVVYRDDHGGTWVRKASEYDDGRYKCVP